MRGEVGAAVHRLETFEADTRRDDDLELSPSAGNNGLGEALFKEVNKHSARQEFHLKKGTIVDASIIDAPSSTRNRSGKRDPEMRQTKKGNQYCFGMKARIGVDAELGLTHSLKTTPANTAGVVMARAVLHGGEERLWGMRAAKEWASARRIGMRRWTGRLR